MKEIILTSSILILLLAIFRQAVRGRIAPRVQYALWLLVAARLLIPGTLFTAPVSVMGAAEDIRISIRERQLSFAVQKCFHAFMPADHGQSAHGIVCIFRPVAAGRVFIPGYMAQCIRHGGHVSNGVIGISFFLTGMILYRYQTVQTVVSIL